MTGYMDRALALARRSLGQTAPNPAVGCVIVLGGVVIGEGRTRAPGQHHAEADALAQCARLGHDPKGATAYVTLEPCCHQGRTPPCSKALIAAGIARVVVGTVDPNPAVNGSGLDDLRAAGVEVELQADVRCARQIYGFTKALVKGIPEVTIKVGSSLDGRLATSSGESKWITGELARADGRRLRATHDGIAVGIGTVMADNPRLTTRIEGCTDPIPVVFDSNLKISPDAALFQGSRRPVILTSVDAPDRDLPADIIRCPRSDHGLDIDFALGALAEHGVHRLLVEGGAKLIRSIVDAGHFDRLVLFQSGKLIPGGMPWLGGSPLGALSNAPHLVCQDVQRVGEDLKLVFLPEERCLRGL